MKDKPGPTAPSSQLAQARELLDQGLARRALMLALDALLAELNKLRDTLLVLQRLTQSQELRPTSPPAAEDPRPGTSRLPEPEERILN